MNGDEEDNDKRARHDRSLSFAGERSSGSSTRGSEISYFSTRGSEGSEASRNSIGSEGSSEGSEFESGKEGTFGFDSSVERALNDAFSGANLRNRSRSLDDGSRSSDGGRQPLNMQGFSDKKTRGSAQAFFDDGDDDFSPFSPGTRSRASSVDSTRSETSEVPFMHAPNRTSAAPPATNQAAPPATSTRTSEEVTLENFKKIERTFLAGIKSKVDTGTSVFQFDYEEKVFNLENKYTIHFSKSQNESIKKEEIENKDKDVSTLYKEIRTKPRLNAIDEFNDNKKEHKNADGKVCALEIMDNKNKVKFEFNDKKPHTVTIPHRLDNGELDHAHADILSFNKDGQLVAFTCSASDDFMKNSQLDKQWLYNLMKTSPNPALNMMYETGAVVSDDYEILSAAQRRSSTTTSTPTAPTSTLHLVPQKNSSRQNSGRQNSGRQNSGGRV